MNLSDDTVVPIYAQTFFCGSREGIIKQILQFDYHDPECFYKNLELNERELDSELSKIGTNMQLFLDEEINKINGEIVKPEVKLIDLGFRGDIDTMPYITFLIEFSGKFNKGLNEYISITPEEKLDYNCRSIWSFIEDTRIIKVKSAMNYEILENNIIFWADKGKTLGGEELIRFII
jgi:hypothetical protein